MDKKALLLIGVAFAIVLVSVIIWNELNTSFFVALLFNDALEFAKEGIITKNFMPAGYTAFVGSCIKVAGTGGIPACQAFVYVGILLAAWWFLTLRGVRNKLLLLGLAVIALHPVLVLNVWRIHDGNLTILLLLGFLAAGIVVMRQKNTWIILALGAFTGLLSTVRMNTITLAVVALIFLMAGLRKSPQRTYEVKRIIMFLGTALIVLVTANVAIKGKPFFFPEHGFYNVFAGTNEYAASYLLKDYSGENSLGLALEARGIHTETFEEWLAFPSEKYKEFALEYVIENPFKYAKLIPLKIFTLLRPGYHVTESFEWIGTEGIKRVSKIVLAAPFFIWIFFLYKTRKNFFEKENLFIVLTVLLYTAPFIVANADPRFRFPLDIIFILDSISRAKILLPRRA